MQRDDRDSHLRFWRGCFIGCIASLPAWIAMAAAMFLASALVF